jgi:hypothetical protein
VGINSVTDPVPESWGLVIENAVGMIDGTGGATAPPGVFVPFDPALSGQSFFLVFALKEGAEAWAVSAPVCVHLR